MHNRRPAATAPRLSIIIPTFNRRVQAAAAIDSALAWLDTLGQGEVIVIDDASADGTEAAVRADYADRIARDQLSFRRLAENRGVTAAKNEGAARARGTWLLFLDSDDRLVPEAAGPAMAAMDAAGDAPLIFFRCMGGAGGRLLGRAESAARRLDINAHMGGWRWGECLPAVRAEAWRAFPYVEALRGYEAIAFGRMIRARGDAILSDVVARRYDDQGADRLTARAGRRRQACLHARGGWHMLREFGGAMPLKVKLRYLRGAMRAAAECALSKLIGPRQRP